MSADEAVRTARRHAREIFDAAVRAADPGRCVSEAIDLGVSQLRIVNRSYSFDQFTTVLVIGAGKATPAMAAAVESTLGDRIVDGAINTKYDHALPLQRIRTTECGHPLPDEAGIRGTEEMVRLLEEADEHTLVLCLFSGGGSALMPAPIAGITLEQKQQTTQLLLECGATIDEINAIRKHLSRVKGGLLARLARPAAVVSLMISDVIGDRLDTIASGPTYPDTTTFADCLEIFERFDLIGRLPRAVIVHLKAGAKGEIADTPSADDPCFEQAVNAVVGNASLALKAAKMSAEKLGYRPLVLSSSIAGETREVAGVHAAIAREIAATGQPLAPPACLISGGETTVTIRGKGKGGRNQEFALAAAIGLRGSSGITVLSGGTDGSDGPTDAAGAIADGDSVRRAQALGLSAAAKLDDNDSYHFFEALDDLVITGPTGTNVMDLRLFLVDRQD